MGEPLPRDDMYLAEKNKGGSLVDVLMVLNFTGMRKQRLAIEAPKGLLFNLVPFCK